MWVDSGGTGALLLNLRDTQEGWWMDEEKGRRKEEKKQMLGKEIDDKGWKSG